MRTVEFEHLRPSEIIDERKRRSIIYLPLGPLEWHTKALPFGTDGLIAHEIACEAARITGGVVLPVLYLGSDCMRSEEQLRRIGFEDTKQYVVGMDFPENSMKSLYMGIDVVAATVKEYLRSLIGHGYKLIVLVSAHGAWNQGVILDEICEEFTAFSDSRVINGLPLMIKEEEVARTLGHANISEASLMMYLTEDVDLSELPPRTERLKCADFGILDTETLSREDAEGAYVVNDPRDASEKLGKQYFDNMVRGLSSYVMQYYEGE